MEYFDIVDGKGIPTGEVIERSEAHRTGALHRTAHIWVLRQTEADVEVLLQKRADDKDCFPGCYDTASAGHITAGDEPLPSAMRELEEELGIQATEEELEFIGTFPIKYTRNFHGKPFVDNEIAFVYIYTKPVEIENLTLQKEELSGVEWFSLDTVIYENQRHNPKFCVPAGGIDLIIHYVRERRMNGANYQL